MSSTTPTRGSAERWGPLWGSEPRAWAAVLDIGCGSGVFLRLAADRGAHVFGLDASEALIEVARERVPEADLRVGEMEALPLGDDTFDLVTGFNSFFFAADMTAALREAGRVAKPGAAVVIQVWGRPEKNDLEAAKVVMRPFLPAPPPGSPQPPALWSPGVLQQIATDAGLMPERTFDTSWAYQIGVVAEERSRGVGHFLLSRVLQEYWAEHPGEVLGLSVEADNMPALKLLRRQGFAPWLVLQSFELWL